MKADTTKERGTRAEFIALLDLDNAWEIAKRRAPGPGCAVPRPRHELELNCGLKKQNDDQAGLVCPAARK